MNTIAYTGADIFDGVTRHKNQALCVTDGVISGIGDAPSHAEIHPLKGGVIAPGFVDLQVNGGGGVMFNADQSVATLKQMAQAHARQGTTAFLPTLITDTPNRTQTAIKAVIDAIDQGVAGVIGLHLEGPHLSIKRKGAHDATLIRPLLDADLELLMDAAERLPHLMLTVAPENITCNQIKALAKAGAVVSLGHTAADFSTCRAAVEAGARCVTHLFNAMSQFTGRAPGLVGAALETGALHAGLIADGIHVSPESIRIAQRAKQGPGALFLVTDAMATSGSPIDEFRLNGRMIYRRNGRLTLQDGTLAGADLDMPTAVKNMIESVGATPDQALTMATTAPANVIGTAAHGTLTIGARADFVHLTSAFKLGGVWQAGEQLGSAS